MWSMCCARRGPSAPPLAVPGADTSTPPFSSVRAAYYDPKSRSMRQDPNPDRDPSQKTFTGDNFVRAAGEATDFKQLNVFAVTAYEKGQDVHMQVRAHLRAGWCCPSLPDPLCARLAAASW